MRIAWVHHDRECIFPHGEFLEAVPWLEIAIGVAIASVRDGGRLRGVCAVGVAAVLAFGMSDLVETRAGAWWRPRRRLFWKGLCVAAITAVVLK